MNDDERRRRFADARVARLATVTADGRPRIVPVVFALVGDAAYSAVDHKPKSTRKLGRLANVRATGVASILVDRYDEDWTSLWWVRVDGVARVLDADSVDGSRGIDALVGKYPQYADARPLGPVIRVDVRRWSAWDGSIPE
ncbi:PPOX class probable F420-dependent enzyme [Antricoccus suffuscus]|uniref:PPOX class probable F420-dependent enzyme n=1 Tax=Antricoccus suffuscus TaxID=1629062 RepID=A0A2T1A0F5_9ACTN|nr:TIGR03668 family PPOX class F420-dependent oxidoreductase [Antricoccus suffuscus]PRZ42014.1 PPOX class probable F420-dependent enzyme [Antricoccus suffuscus]